MIKLIFATSNPDKLSESRRIMTGLVGDMVQILDSNQAKIKIDHDVAETGQTFAQNSYIKAQAWLNQSPWPVVAEDAGLCIEALAGKPGVKSNRWLAGSAQDRNREILKLMTNQTNRRAYFTSVFCLLYPDQSDRPVYFTGLTYGSIVSQPAETGHNGFGYDPIFVPDGSYKTYAQMIGGQKDQFSHRAKALKQVVQFLGL